MGVIVPGIDSPAHLSFLVYSLIRIGYLRSSKTYDSMYLLVMIIFTCTLTPLAIDCCILGQIE